MVVKGTCPDRSCIKQLRIYHARHQYSLRFTGSTNVGHEPSQGGPTLDGFGSRDLQVFAEAKPSIQLHTQVLMLFFHLISCSPKTILEYLKDLLWTYPRPLRGATCHLFLERPFVALIYHPPVAQIVIYHSQQVVWNLFAHNRLDADVPSRGIERIGYVNANQRAESLTLCQFLFLL